MEPLPTQTPVPDPAGAEEAALAAESMPNGPDSEAWRTELAARLNRYRSRRKAPPPRYPSLRLPFGAAAAAPKMTPLEDLSTTVSPSAFIRDPSAEAFGPARATSSDGTEIETARVLLDPPAGPPQGEPAVSPLGSSPGAKIIEFPRFAWGPPPPPPDQLAEPVMELPRILEVPENVPPPPALGGITIELARLEEPEKRLGIDIPLQGAPLGGRMLAAAVDGLIVATASALFGFIFWKISLVRPPQFQMLSLVAGIPCMFWAAYQYLLIVYTGSTPGLRLARLQLSRFDGTPTKRSLRRWRILASYLSAASLGMGYAWLFLDEDSLCWHDRITHTYLAPRKPDSKG